MEHKIFPHLPEEHLKGVESPLVVGNVFDKMKNVVHTVVEKVKEVVHVKKDEPKKAESKPEVKPEKPAENK